MDQDLTVVVEIAPHWSTFVVLVGKKYDGYVVLAIGIHLLLPYIPTACGDIPLRTTASTCTLLNIGSKVVNMDLGIGIYSALLTNLHVTKLLYLCSMVSELPSC